MNAKAFGSSSQTILRKNKYKAPIVGKIRLKNHQLRKLPRKPDTTIKQRTNKAATIGTPNTMAGRFIPLNEG